MPVIKLRHCANCSRPVHPNQRCTHCGQAHGAARRKLSGYSTAKWKKLRDAAIAEQPWCSICGSTRDLTGDHLVYPAQSQADVRVLCRFHNSQDGAYRREGY